MEAPRILEAQAALTEECNIFVCYAWTVVLGLEVVSESEVLHTWLSCVPRACHICHEHIANVKGLHEALQVHEVLDTRCDAGAVLETEHQ